MSTLYRLPLPHNFSTFVKLRKSKIFKTSSLLKRSIIGIFTLLGLLFFQNCKKNDQIPDEITAIPVHLEVERFDQKFAAATAATLPDLMKSYPLLFPKQYDSLFWQKKIQDTLQQQLNNAVAKAFPDFDTEQKDLETLFQHIKYYYPKTPLPKIITVTSDVDYRNKVILADTLLIVALDTYLGEDHPFYTGIQGYFVQNFRKEQIDVDVGHAFAKAKMAGSGGRRFLDEMIYQGKILYLMERLLTLKDKNEIMGYTKEQLEWAKANEVNIWTYFVERKLLFDTDPKLLGRFIDPAPFSKFNMELDKESPPELGRYIGWQIVRAYMDYNEVSLQELSDTSTDTIFENAKYKPLK